MGYDTKNRPEYTIRVRKHIGLWWAVVTDGPGYYSDDIRLPSIGSTLDSAIDKAEAKIERSIQKDQDYRDSFFKYRARS